MPRIPLIPERYCYGLRALAIVVLRGKIAVNLEGNRFFSNLRVVSHNLEVVGSNPTPATFPKPLPNIDLTYLPVVGSAARKSE